jgi:hypothetical protein
LMTKSFGMCCADRKAKHRAVDENGFQLPPVLIVS